ncbi:MAG: right-handed parallel beta-helix repeat-containing protein, partial [Planctomycetota bacterium]
MCKKLMCFILLLGLSGAVLATDYYVSPSGNDNDTGTSPSTAWQTIDKVNSMTFLAGDSISFEGGETFSGQLDFTSDGTPTSPITVGSYGTGRATLSNPTMGVEGSESTGLRISNVGGYEIRDLILVGPGNEGDRWSENVGIRLHAQLGSGQRLDYIRIDNVEVSEYSGYGILVYGEGYSGFRDVEITNCVLHHIGKEGICSSSSEWPMSASSHNDFYIGDCTMYMITGVGTRGPHSGSGINLSAVDGGLIEFCEAYDSGSWCMAEGGGPLGIWCWEAENLVFQFNEVHNQKTSGGDGGGFDLDGGSSFCTMQYNYSHDNFGGDLLMQFSRSRYAGDNIYRYNINANQGQFNSMGGVTFYSDSKLENVEVYNNTFYVGPDAQPGSSAIDVWVWHGSYSNINLHNNIFMAEAGKTLIRYDTLSGFTFQNNLYWQSGAPLVITDGSTEYNSLDAWRSATGQEMLDGQPVGLEVSPQLVDVHDHPALGPHNLANLAGFKLKSASQCRDAGLDLQTLFGIDPGTRDFWGNSIPQGSLFDVGGHEYPGGGSAPPPDGTPPSAPSGLTATAAGFK